MTKDELKARIVPTLTVKHRKDLSWNELVRSVQGATNEEKAALVGLIAAGSHAKAGKLMFNLVNSLMRSDAEGEADDMLADDSLSLDEIERAFR